MLVKQYQIFLKSGHENRALEQIVSSQWRYLKGGACLILKCKNIEAQTSNWDRYGNKFATQEGNWKIKWDTQD
jgi:hypothetical protein